MTIGPCRLCGTVGELQESHVIPKFVYKWMKETSGTGHLRFGQQPNRRVQDGYKFHWLCENCEQLFNTWETQFANQIFHPLNEDSTYRTQYESWFLKFCVSISWRVLNLHIEKNIHEHLSEELLERAMLANRVWKKFLLGEKPHPEKHEQHFLPMDALDSFSYPNMPSNINRYILRSVDIDLVSGKERAFIYSKLGRFIILGFIEMPRPRDWVGTKVHVREGLIEPKDYTLPTEFGDYFVDKARQMDAIYDVISEEQNTKIEKTFLKDLDRAAESESFKAMDYDVRLFGKEAFKKEK